MKPGQQLSAVTASLSLAEEVAGGNDCAVALSRAAKYLCIHGKSWSLSHNLMLYSFTSILYRKC